MLPAISGKSHPVTRCQSYMITRTGASEHYFVRERPEQGNLPVYCWPLLSGGLPGDVSGGCRFASGYLSGSNLQIPSISSVDGVWGLICLDGNETEIICWRYRLDRQYAACFQCYHFVNCVCREIKFIICQIAANLDFSMAAIWKLLIILMWFVRPGTYSLKRLLHL